MTQSRAKVTTESLYKLVYGLSIGDKSGDPLVTRFVTNRTMAYFSGEQIFLQGISRTLFGGARRNLAVLWVWPMNTYSPNLVNFFSGGQKFDSGYIALFVEAQRNLAALGVWPIVTYSRNFVNFGPG